MQLISLSIDATGVVGAEAVTCHVVHPCRPVYMPRSCAEFLSCNCPLPRSFAPRQWFSNYRSLVCVSPIWAFLPCEFGSHWLVRCEDGTVLARRSTEDVRHIGRRGGERSARRPSVRVPAVAGVRRSDGAAEVGVASETEWLRQVWRPLEDRRPDRCAFLPTSEWVERPRKPVDTGCSGASGRTF